VGGPRVAPLTPPCGLILSFKKQETPPIMNVNPVPVQLAAAGLPRVVAAEDAPRVPAAEVGVAHKTKRTGESTAEERLNLLVSSLALSAVVVGAHKHAEQSTRTRENKVIAMVSLGFCAMVTLAVWTVSMVAVTVLVGVSWYGGGGGTRVFN
jgi:hypothetical protein